MAASPYISFTEFSSRSDRALNGWSNFRERVRAGARAAAEQSGTPLTRTGESRLTPLHSTPVRAVQQVGTVFTGGIWRLLALNNREIARSLFLYESRATATEHVLRLQQVAGELAVVTIHGPEAMQHGWYTTLDDVAVMSCGRWYPAAGLCQEAAAFSVESLRSAIVVAEPVRRAQRGAARLRPAMVEAPGGLALGQSAAVTILAGGESP